MSTRALLVDSAERIFADHCDKALLDAAERGEFPERLLTVLVENGLDAMAMPDSGIALGDVHRYLVPNLWALNFLLERSLGGGGTVSLFTDAQGKTYGQALLRCRVRVPKALLDTIDDADRAASPELS